MKSHASIASALGLSLCVGGNSCRLDHQVGAAELGLIHYAGRRRSWPDTHRVLKLCALAIDPSINEDVPWRRVYRLNIAARTHGRNAGVRVPARTLAFDRAFVKAGVAGIGNDVPLRKEAYDWARR